MRNLSAALALLATALVASPPVLRATLAPGADSPVDGVWVGTLQSKTAAGTYVYPLLLNLDGSAGVVVGVALLPDDLMGNPRALAYLEIEGTAKGSKLNLTVPAIVGDARRTDALRLDLRYRKGALVGKARGAGLKPGRVLLLPVDGERPWQQVWTAPLDEAGAGGPFALSISQAKRLAGIGMRGAEFGPLAQITVTGNQLAATLRLPSGDVPLDLQLQDGMLLGNAREGSRTQLRLFPGGIEKQPAITSLSPREVPAGVPTEITVRGRDLAAGFLLRLDHQGVISLPPEILDATRAVVRIEVDIDTPAGTDLGVVAIGTDGSSRDAGELRTSAAPIVSFQNDVAPVFAASCALSGCHVTPPPDPEYGNGQAPADLVLEGNAAYGNLVGQPSFERPELLRVKPGDPDASYLVMKLRGTPGIVGDRMPFGGPYLSESTIARIVAWIRNGAPRN